MTTYKQPIQGKSFFLGGLLMLAQTTYGQHISHTTSNKVSLNLSEALNRLKENSPYLLQARIQTEVAHEKVKEEKEIQLPDLDFHASYYRMSNMVEYQHADQVVHYQTIPDIYDATVNVKMPLYQGGRIKIGIKQAEKRVEIAQLQEKQVYREKALEVIQTYLGICKLVALDSLLKETLKEQNERLNLVSAFKKNGTITKEEVLQASLQCSNSTLDILTNERNTKVLLNDLKTLLQIPERDTLLLDTKSALSMNHTELLIDKLQEGALNREEVKIKQQATEINELGYQSIKASTKPTLSLFGTFGYNYPNYMLFLFPPHPYLYSLGRIGIDMNFSISHLFKVKTKLAMAKQSIELAQVQEKIQKDAIQDAMYRRYMAWLETQDKIKVIEKAIAQANENYRILKQKYFNQMALHTELMDADTALFRTRYQLLSAQIDAVAKYYDLLYTSGQLN
ncbi:TolC family protein [Flectobacillus rivi]|uniref:TolC family protein n=1 Tax=Flectobacillus rivi TaxID=2984209 RepID=A0ABT6YY85_9BACT|nr:TolC family protein [Flectobacillus rivi]MDI9873829.1 TolC family protein [Flectobacillus rivi]